MSDLITQESAAIAIKAELDTQIMTAKAYPRDVKKFLQDAIMMATLNEETAASCIYSLPRGKGKDLKTITGESVRLAEILQSAWGNMHSATRVIENDGKTITCEGVAWDLEKNVKTSKQVKRSIQYSGGGTYSTDMQTVTAMAAQAIAFRNAVLCNIPRAYAKEVYNAAVSFSVGDQTKLSKRIEIIFDRFSKLGILKENIFLYFNKKDVSEFTAQDVEEMIGIGTAIKEGHIKIDDAFKIEKITTGASELNQKLKPKEEIPEEISKEAKEFFGEENKPV